MLYSLPFTLGPYVLFGQFFKLLVKTRRGLLCASDSHIQFSYMYRESQNAHGIKVVSLSIVTILPKITCKKGDIFRIPFELQHHVAVEV